MIEVLKNTVATISTVFSAGDADSSVTYAVVDQDGVSVQSGTATHGGTGAYSFVLQPHSSLAWLVVTWTGAWGGVTQSIATGAGQNDGTAAEVQVTGGHLFTVAQMRAATTITSSVTDATVIDARARVTMMFEDYCDVAFVPRYGRCVTSGEYDITVWLPNTKVTAVTAVTVNGNALSASELAALTVDIDGRIYRNGYFGIWDGTFPRNITVSYEHGYQRVPQDLQRAAMMFTEFELTSNKLADRTIGLVNEFGIVRQSVPGPDKPTGIPFVDETLNRYREMVKVC